MNKIIARPWLSLQCQMIPGVRHAVFAANQRAGGDFGTLETWPDGAEAHAGVMALLRKTMTSGATEAEQYEPAPGQDAGASWIVASPLRRGGQVCGGVAVEVSGLDAAQVPVVVQLMNWGSAWPAFLADQEDARRQERQSPAAKIVLQALSGDNLKASMAAAATVIARNYGARRAAIGTPLGTGAAVAALSGRAVFDSRSDHVRRLEAAMNEACDQGASMTWPQADADDTALRVTVAHARLAGGEGGDCICTVPMRLNTEPGGALLLIRDAARPFTSHEVEELESLAALLGPAIDVRQRAEHSALERLRQSFDRNLKRLTGPAHHRLKAGAAAVILLLLFGAFAGGTLTVPADARLAGLVERELVAPADGFVAQAHVRAGARVQAGELLATLDDGPLRLELKRWQSQHDELSNEYHRALGELDRGTARILKAQVAQAQTQIALVKSVIERTRITAPFDGLVVSGDLSQSLGRPVKLGEALFTVAPEEGYRVLLQIEESSVPNIALGSTGRLALAALPGEKFSIRVTRLNGMAQSADGSNVLEVEASLEGESRHLRPGMKGVARLDAGRARLLWIWTHGPIAKLREWWWAWSPVA